MGAHTLIRVLPDMDATQLRAKVDELMAQDAWEDGNSYSGSWGVKRRLTIEFTVFESVEQAKEYVSEKSDTEDPLYAVRAMHYAPKSKPKKLLALEENLTRLGREINRFPNTLVQRVKSGKSKTKGCAHCGSSVAVVYIQHEHCPVCKKEFLYTETDRKRLKRLIDKREALLKTITDFKRAGIEALRAKGKEPRVWVVGGWCKS